MTERPRRDQRALRSATRAAGRPLPPLDHARFSSLRARSSRARWWDGSRHRFRLALGSRRSAPGCISLNAPFRPPHLSRSPTARQEAAISLSHVPRHLLHPPRIGGARYPRNVYLPGRYLHEGQHVIGHQASGGPYLRREEVHRSWNLHVCSNELSPAHPLSPFWRRRWS